MFRVSIKANHPVEHAGGVDRLAQQFELKQHIQLVDYRTCFPIIERRLASPGRNFLEIGSSTGHFLDLARLEGWNVTGVEPDENVAAQAIENFDVNVEISDLRNVKFPDDHFDVVVMFHVIEHFLDPLAEINEIYRILRSGGILVAETPRFDTMWFRLLKERERSVIPDHFFYFTRKTLSEMVTTTGFSVFRLDSVGRTLSLDRLISNVAKVIDAKAISSLLINFSNALNFDQVVFHINTRDMMRIYTQK
jgi:SAM-dependent methyltransferase